MGLPTTNLYCQLTADDASLTKTGSEVTSWAVKSGSIGAANFTRTGATGPSNTGGDNYCLFNTAGRAMENTADFAIAAQPTTIGIRVYLLSTARQAFTDGVSVITKRNLMENSATNVWAYYAGTYRQSATTATTATADSPGAAASESAPRKWTGAKTWGQRRTLATPPGWHRG